MKKFYDTIVVGAGNGGLVAACTLQKAGKSVLLLEKNNVPGGMASSFVRGRFEFETALHELCDYGSNEKVGNVRKLFAELDIETKLDFVDVPEAFSVVVNNEEKEEYIMPFGIEEFSNKMETYVPGSYQSIKDFFELAKECKDAMAYISSTNGHPKESELKTNYANFTRVASYPVQTIFDKLNMPKKAQEILSTYWVYLGAPTEVLSFVHYAIMVYNYIDLKAQIPIDRSHGINLALENQFVKMGGEIRYNYEVDNILVDNNKVIGISSKDEIISCRNVICNINPNIVYGNMIDPLKVPVNAIKLCNKRELGARGFSIYLGLNRSAEELGIDRYSYFIFNSLDSNKQYETMKTLDNDSSVVICLNNAIPNCSNEGTCILEFTSLYFSDCFDENVSVENYYNLKEDLALKFIEKFENSTGIKIKDYIEEIEIATPSTFARYANSPQGTIYGYAASKGDNLLSRMMGMFNEDYIQGLKFCGGSSFRLSGYSSSYLSGESVAKMILSQMNKGGE